MSALPPITHVEPRSYPPGFFIGKNAAGLSPMPANFREQSRGDDGEQRVMHSILSLLSGAVLAGLVYGLSFVPTATLAQDEEVMTEEGTNSDALAKALETISSE